MSSAKVVPLTCHGHSRPITHLSFSPMLPDGQFYLISACKDNNPMLRDGMTGDWIGTFIGHKGAVWQSRLSPDSKLAVTGSADFTAKIWDTFTGECQYTLPHQHIVRSVAFQKTSQPLLLATGGFEKRLRIFDLGRGSPSTSNASSPTSPTGVAEKPTLMNYELGAGVHGGTIKSIVWCSDYNLLITAADDKWVRWWDLRERGPIASAMLDGPPGTCEINPSYKSSSSHKSILSVAAGKCAYFFDGDTPGQLVKKVKTAHDIASVALHIDERKFIVGGSGDTWVRVYSLDDESELDLHKGHHGPVWSTNFAPNGKHYATGSEDGTIKLWKFCNGAYGLWQ